MERIRVKLENSQADQIEFEKACIQLSKLCIELEASITTLEHEVSNSEKEIKEMQTSNTLNGVKLDKIDEKKIAETSKAVEKLAQEIRNSSELITEKEKELSSHDGQLEILDNHLRNLANKEMAGKKWRQIFLNRRMPKPPILSNNSTLSSSKE